MVIVSRLEHADPSWNLAVLAYWSAVEVNLAIVCGCLTTLRPLFVRLFPRLGVTTAIIPGSEGAPNTIGGTTRHYRQPAIPSRSFLRLDGDSTKSEESLHRTSFIELGQRGK
jgi:rhodopsin domain-containing protein